YETNTMRIISDDDTVAGLNGNSGYGNNPSDGAGSDSKEYNQVKTLQFDVGADGGTVAWNIANSSTVSGAVGITFSVDASGSFIITQDQGGTAVEIAKITLDENTGKYVYTQTGNVIHENDGNNTENEASFVIGFTVTDGDGDKADGNLTLLIDDDTPVILNDTVSADEDSIVYIDVLANDSLGADNIAMTSDPLTNPITITTNPTNGTAEVVWNIDEGKWQIKYDSDENYNGNDSIGYKITDADGDVSPEATVSVTVNPVNDAPIANNDFEEMHINFNSNSSMVVQNSPELELGKDNSDFTVSFSMYLDIDHTGAWRNIMHKGDTNSERGPGIWMHPNTNKIHYTLSSTTNWNNNKNSVAEIELNEWTEISYVKEGQTVSLYINGVKDSSFTFTGDSLSNTGIFSFGDDSWYQGFDGSMDNIQIHNKALSSTEVEAVSKGEVIIGDELVAYYDFEGVNPYNDKSGNENNGQVQNNPVLENSLTTIEEEPISIRITDLIANDSDVDGSLSELELTLVAGTEVGGTAVLDGLGNVIFTPDLDYNGKATFEYTVTDQNGTGLTSNIATVSIDVTPVDDAPEFNYNTVAPFPQPVFSEYYSSEDGSEKTFAVGDTSDQRTDTILSFNNELTMIAWVKFDSVINTSSNERILELSNSNGWLDSTAIALGNGTDDKLLRVWTNDESSSEKSVELQYDISSLLGDETYHQIAYSISNASLDLYIDGVLVDNSVLTNPIDIIDASKINIGGYDGGSGHAPNASIDNIEVYDIVLTANQIGELYDQTVTVTDVDGGEIDMVSLLANATSEIGDNLDTIDLTSGDHILSNIDYLDVIAMTDADNTLKIITDGDSSTGDKVKLDTADWSPSTTPDAEGYTTYTSTTDNTVKLLIEADNVEI
ncbi:LamG-like jellyroll fold domain-containing protein, partial [Arcobacter sp. LA11]|uniref:LamG-like jellyroll fold domain-containing protein n=1 Tax=Arcobacter sp. LA11 TaxID=1898176 RepID=UPI000A689925